MELKMIRSTHKKSQKEIGTISLRTSLFIMQPSTDPRKSKQLEGSTESDEILESLEDISESLSSKRLMDRWISTTWSSL